MCNYNELEQIALPNGKTIKEVNQEVSREVEKITQAALAEKVGVNKSYISRIEKGVIEPGVGLFYRIIEALGLRIEIVRTMA